MIDALKRKGIILAGGKGTRLSPITLGVSKQLVPIYNKPMIYYPLTTLMWAGITEFLIISMPDDITYFKRLLGNGSKFGITIEYASQEKPNGLAQAFVIGADFIGESNVALALGDNLFHGQELVSKLRMANSRKVGATIFAYQVKDPKRYGVVEFNKEGKVISIEEKPENPKGNHAVVGLYYYPNSVVNIAKKITPSKRGELEITSINNEYLKRGELEVEIMGQGFTWLDAGTNESLIEASNYIKTIEARQGLKVACLEIIAYKMGYISKVQLLELAKLHGNSSYGEYLIQRSKEF